MVDLAPFLYLALVIDIVAGLVVVGICYLVGSYLHRTFSGRFRDPLEWMKAKYDDEKAEELDMRVHAYDQIGSS